MTSNLGSKSVSNKYVVNHLWDATEINFLACYTKCYDNKNTEAPGKPALISLFVHEDLGVVVHGSQLGKKLNFRALFSDNGCDFLGSKFEFSCHNVFEIQNKTLNFRALFLV